MRIPALPRLLAALLAFALVAAACSDDPAAEELIDDLLDDDADNLDDGSAGIGEDDGDPADDVDPDPGPSALGIPSAPAPDPDDTPLPVDGDVRIITLDNGLTVLLRSNDSPGGALHLRLVVNAGSVQQSVANDGSAHFLEHMLFNGTERFPANELTAQLQRLGIDFGADVNAYTSYDETVYFLAASLVDPEAPEIALDVLAEWAGRATIAEDQVAAEIGVVRDELRQRRESVDGLVQGELERIYVEGTPYDGYQVIGDPALVEATTSGPLREYYDTWYRPDNMAIIVVGDLPLDRMEGEVRERFEGLTARGDTPAREDIVVALDPSPVAEVIVQPDNANDNLSYDIRLPVWDLGTVGGERMAVIEEAVALMLQTRLDEAFQRGDIDADFTPGFHTFPVNRGLRYYGTNLQGPDLAVLLDQFQSQLLAAAVDGFTADDAERAKGQLLAQLDDELATLASKQDFQFAGELQSFFLEGGSLDGAANRIDRLRTVISDLTADDLTDFWRWILGASGPIVVPIGADAATLPTADEVQAILDAARPASSGEEVVAIDELMAPPEPAAVADERRISTFSGNVTVWTFDNGVTVAHQYSDIAAGQVAVWAESDGGWSALDEPDASLATAAVSAVLQSGVGPHGPSTLARYLEPLDLGVDAAIEEGYEGIYGGSATDDVADLFALMHLTMAEPRVDEVALRSVGRQGETALEFLESNPDVQLIDTLTDLLTDGDVRYELNLTQAEIDDLDGDELLALFEDRFSTPDDLVVSIVGDVDVDDARDLAARYFGTLPAGDPDSWVDLGVTPPDEFLTAEIVLNDGTADGGLTRFDWQFGGAGADTELAASLLSIIITNRITDVIREALGASYGGSANVSVDYNGPTTVSSYIQVDGDPSRLAEIDDALNAMLTELSTAGPTADEFGRAVAVLENEYGFVNNGLFLAENLNRLRFPTADILTVDDRFVVLDTTNGDDIRDLAAALYGSPGSIEISRVLP